MEPHPLEHEHATDSGWLERADPEWERAWSHFPDPVMAHPVSGECLQYLVQFQKTCCAMTGRGVQETTTRSALHFQVPLHSNSLGDALGSAQYPECGWVHVFRHRQVPESDQRQYWHGAASPRWPPV